MAAYARLVVLLLIAALGLSPWSGTRELRRAAPVDGIEQQASRPDGHSIAINRSEKSRGVHQPRAATSEVDPAAAADEDELALFDRVYRPADVLAMGDALQRAASDVARVRRTGRVNAARGPPVLA